MPALYELMREENKDLERKTEKKLNKTDLVTADIFTNIDEDELCAKTFEEFSRIYGSDAGNLALTTLCFGGIFLVGVSFA